jgi:hypothetical protein
MAQHDLLVIDNSTIDRLLTNPQVLAAIPSLRRPPSIPGHRPCCGSTSTVDYAAIKTSLAGLNSQAAQVIKDALNTRQIRFFRQTTHNGKPAVVRVTR